MTLTIKSILIDQDVESMPSTKALVRKLGVPARIIDDPAMVFQAVNQHPDPVAAGKEILFITRNRGKFIKKCPGTRYYNCCGYVILHLGSFCTMDCSYCILQSYFHPPVLQYFANHTDMLSELAPVLSGHGVKRIGTGEFTDSLIWEPWTDMTADLIPRFAEQSVAVLELKTKTTEIQNLHRFDHRKKTIMAWSLNTNRVIASEERNTTSLTQRLEAARDCQEMGYPLAFHFDPIVLYPGCEAEYHEVVRQLFQIVNPGNIVWISIGTFRFMPDLKQIITRRFADSRIVYGEFITGLDNKMRYFKPLRMAFYRKFVDDIRKMAPDVLLYYCMEDDEVWKKTMGFIPKEKGGLARLLDQSAIAHCGLSPDR